MATWLAELRNRSIAARGAFLGLVVLGLYGLVAPVAYYCGGQTGMLAAVAAAFLCLAGATVALVVSHALREPNHALYGMLLGMAARMGIPMGFGLLCHMQGGALAEAGLLYYLLVFYPVTLGVETALSLPRSQPPVSGSPVSGSDVSKDTVT